MLCDGWRYPHQKKKTARSSSRLFKVHYRSLSLTFSLLSSLSLSRSLFFTLLLSVVFRSIQEAILCFLFVFYIGELARSLFLAPSPLSLSLSFSLSLALSLPPLHQ